MIKAFKRFYKRPNKRNEFYVKEKHDFSQFGKGGPQSEPVGLSRAHTQIAQIFVHSVSCHCLPLGSKEGIVMDWQGAQQAPVVSCLQQTGGSRSEPGIIQQIWKVWWNLSNMKHLLLLWGVAKLTVFDQWHFGWASNKFSQKETAQKGKTWNVLLWCYLWDTAAWWTDMQPR